MGDFLVFSTLASSSSSSPSKHIFKNILLNIFMHSKQLLATKSAFGRNEKWEDIRGWKENGGWIAIFSYL
ncbi:hypothetical protein FCV25MIE_24379, partial [Fagus crenata]